ncbi:MAG: MerR family transcriptional regulator [Candidatus Aminicenantes bacterium]|nr:MerR family transcriptional regulator [Candidatus Aminicenantes bacterium]
MDKKMMLKDSFLKRIGVKDSKLKEWQNLKLIKPDGMTSDHIPFFTHESVKRAQKIKELVNMGYGTSEIQKIIKKVGLPGAGDPVKQKGKTDQYLTVGVLAEKVGVSPRTIKYWEDKGIIEADMRSEGGFRLYADVYIYWCELIKDLQLFGYSLEEIKEISDLFRDFLEIDRDLDHHPFEKVDTKLNVMLEKIDDLYKKMDQLNRGIERWEELLNKKKKEITSLKQQNTKRKKSKRKKRDE